MEVVAEGTETATQIDKLKDMACKYAQGFLFSQPLDGNALAKALANGVRLQPNVDDLVTYGVQRMEQPPEATPAPAATPVRLRDKPAPTTQPQLGQATNS